MWCGKGWGNLITVAIFSYITISVQDIGDDTVLKQPSSALQVSAFCEKFSTWRLFICNFKYRYIYFEFYQSITKQSVACSFTLVSLSFRGSSICSHQSARARVEKGTRKSCQFRGGGEHSATPGTFFVLGSSKINVAIYTARNFTMTWL